jgi:hypothetical protein
MAKSELFIEKFTIQKPGDRSQETEGAQSLLRTRWCDEYSPREFLPPNS